VSLSMLQSMLLASLSAWLATPRMGCPSLTATPRSFTINAAQPAVTSTDLHESLRGDLSSGAAQLRQTERAKDVQAVLEEMCVDGLDAQHRQLMSALRQTAMEKDAAEVVSAMELIELRVKNEQLAAAVHEAERRVSAEAANRVLAAMELIDTRADNDRLVSAVRHSSAEYIGLPFVHSFALAIAHIRTAATAGKADALWRMSRSWAGMRRSRRSFVFTLQVLKVRLGLRASRLHKSLTSWRAERKRTIQLAMHEAAPPQSLSFVQLP